MKISYPVDSESIGKTLLSYIEGFGFGKPKIYMLFCEKRIQIHGVTPSKTYRLQAGDIIQIDYQEQRDFLPDKKKLDILYEDEYLLIVNKPKHILVHPDDKSKQGTMCNIVSYYYQNKNIDLSIKYAHRLDIDTTGILIFAKDSLTLAKLDLMISTHELARKYLCIVWGHFKEKNGTINAPIGEDRHHQQRKRVSKTGKPAITHYTVLKEYSKFSLVKVQLETGRTHQIRVHMAYTGHAIVGDQLYGGVAAERPMLHSYEVEFIHPVTKKEIHLIKDIPYDMKEFLSKNMK